MTRKKIALLATLALVVVPLIVVAVYQLSPSRRLNRHIVKARISSNSGQYGKALTEYEKALEISPSHQEALCELGFVRLALEQPDRAEKQFEHCIQVDPNYEKAWLGLVRARLALKNIEGASDAGHTLLKLNRTSETLLACGEICIARRAFDEGLDAYKQAIALKQDDYEPLRRTVTLLRQLKRVDEARQRLLEFVNRPDANDREMALMALSEIALANDRLPESLGYLDRAVEIKSSPELLMQRAELLVLLNRFDRAAQDIETIAREQPSLSPRAHKVRAACLFEKNEVDAAMRDALVAQRALNDDPQVALLLSRIYYKNKSQAQAEQEARRALVLSPDFFPAQNFLMSMLIDSGKYDQAIALGKELSRRVRRNEAAMRMWIRACMEAKQPEEAQRALDSVRNADSRDGIGFNAGSSSALDLSKDAEEAIEKLKQLNPKELDTPSNQFLLGQACLRAKKLPDAIRAFERSAELDPSRTETLTALAGVHLALGNSELGAGLLERVIDQHPDSQNAINWLARIRMDQRRYKDADELFAKLREIDSNALPPLMNQIKAKLLARDGKGLSTLADSLETSDSPDLKAVSFLVQAVLAHSKNPQASREFIDKAVAASPNFGPALHEKAITSIHDGKLSEAIELLSRIETAHVRPTGSPRLDYGTALLMAGQLERARTVAVEEHLLLRNQQSLMLLAAVHLKMNQPGAAREQIKKMPRSIEYETLSALVDLPNAGPVCEKLALADVYARAGRGTWANKAFDEAVALAPESPDLAAIRAHVMIRSGNVPEGMSLLKEVSAKHPKRIDVAILLAELHQAQRNTDQAIDCYKQVLRLQPNHARALTSLGTLYLQRGDNSAASNYLQQAVKQSPEDLVCLNNYVWVMAVELKSPQRALPYAEELLRLAPHNANTLDTAGLALLLNDEIEKAEKTLAYAATLSPNDPDVAYHYALALSRNSKPASAFAELKRAKAMKKEFKNRKEVEKLVEELERIPLATKE